jgi:hypothetical protein
MTAGGAMAAFGGVMAALGTLTVTAASGDAASLVAIGAGLFGAGVLQVPGWARRRRQQFERIAERLKDAIRS